MLKIKISCSFHYLLVINLVSIHTIHINLIHPLKLIIYSRPSEFGFVMVIQALNPCNFGVGIGMII